MNYFNLRSTETQQAILMNKNRSMIRIWMITRNKWSVRKT